MPSKSALATMCGIFLFLVGFFLPSSLLSAVYYVDPQNGSDSNPGTQALPWKNIPGTCELDNSGFLTPSGWVRVNAGDTIRIKSGTTIHNRLHIDSTWYQNGTSSAPITVRRDESWGTGPVVFDGGQQTLGVWDSLVFIYSRDYITLDGITENGIIIQNSRARGFQATGTSETARMVGLKARNLKLYNNLYFNVYLQRQDSFLLENLDIDGNKQDSDLSGGLQIGDNTYGCSNGRVVNCKSYNHGDTPGSQTGGTDARIGFWLTNSSNVTYENCVAYNNEGNGFDAGVVGSPPSAIANNIKYVNCEAYNNSNGFSSNLDDIPGTTGFWYVNSIARDNSGAGWMIYNGAAAYLYNCLTTGHVWGMYVDAPAYQNRNTVVDIKNTIFYKNSKSSGNNWDIWVHRADDLVLTSDYNHFEQGDQNVCITWNGAAQSGIYYYYNSTDAPGSTRREWYVDHRQDARSLCSVDREYAYFVDPQTYNYRLTARSDLINKATVISNANIPEIQKDKDGNTRPASGPWDIGPYEYVPAICTYSISLPSASFAASGGTGSVTVTASGDICSWTAVSNAAWVRVTSGASRTGSGTVNYSVSANSGAARTGTLTIAKNSFTVSQAGVAIPKISVSPRSINFGLIRRGSSKSGQIAVTNAGPGTLNINAISITGTNSADFSQTNNCSSLSQGASCFITAGFAPTRTGTRKATLVISSNDPSSRTVNVSLTGRGY
ncbi:MAG: hypothetical protein A4E57_01169 [Syntrophorhabdaceae bacterium PtaU1.Bin034]|nr:MAG: hypothetical protein A4E57_01169 [Syntrophorhabdaceae bacterium PtaU1.Bin034]